MNAVAAGMSGMKRKLKLLLMPTAMHKLKSKHSNTLQKEVCKMRNWNWTPRAKFIGELLTAVAVVAAGWVLFVGTWFALGGN
jgi:hypothetical protein